MGRTCSETVVPLCCVNSSEGWKRDGHSREKGFPTFDMCTREGDTSIVFWCVWLVGLALVAVVFSS